MKTSSAKVRDYRRPYNKYRKAKTPFEYLMQRIFIDTGSDDVCWIFTGGKDRDGYGQCHDSRSAKDLGVTRAHQMSYKIFKGDIPEGMYICHTCDNPSCVNPDHLFIGTPKDNTEDMWEKGRWKPGGLRKLNHEYVNSQWGLKSSIILARELGCSYSRICQIWRDSGKRGKNFAEGDKRCKQKTKSERVAEPSKG